MSKSKVAPSEQLSMVIDPHRHLSHFGAGGRACPEVPEALRPDPFFLNLPKPQASGGRWTNTVGGTTIGGRSGVLFPPKVDPERVA